MTDITVNDINVTQMYNDLYAATIRREIKREVKTRPTSLATVNIANETQLLVLTCHFMRERSLAKFWRAYI